MDYSMQNSVYGPIFVSCDHSQNPQCHSSYHHPGCCHLHSLGHMNRAPAVFDTSPLSLWHASPGLLLPMKFLSQTREVFHVASSWLQFLRGSKLRGSKLKLLRETPRIFLICVWEQCTRIGQAMMTLLC